MNSKILALGGKMDGGNLSTLCLMKMVEDKSDNGKQIFNQDKEQYNVTITFTLLSIDDLTNSGVS